MVRIARTEVLLGVVGSTKKCPLLVLLCLFVSSSIRYWYFVTTTKHPASLDDESSCNSDRRTYSE